MRDVAARRASVGRGLATGAPISVRYRSARSARNTPIPPGRPIRALPILVPHSPVVAVTATARPVAGVAQLHPNAAYFRALEGAGLVPLIVPPMLDAGRAVRGLDGVDGLPITGGEDVDPALCGESPHPTVGGVDPVRDATEIALARGAGERRLPARAI